MVSALNRKLLRDLLRMRGQALAIGLVVASGVAVYVTYLSSYAALVQAQSAFYESHRFGDVFASLKRAPRAVAADLAAIPGVTAVEARIVAMAPLDLPDVDRPASAWFVSIPPDRRPRVNDLYLRSGRWVARGRSDEALISEGFALANGLGPGDRLDAIINGRLRRLTIAGVALSPEYVYTIRPGAMVPDDRHFGVVWMDEEALAAAWDLTGSFNDVSMRIAPGASRAQVLEDVDRLLAPYGGLGATGRDEQPSHWSLQGELQQLESMGVLLPILFLAIASFILHVALTRALALQRPQIAALKALGYSDLALGWHYLKWALVIAGAGIPLGFGAGAWMAQAIGSVYNDFFRFPSLTFVLPLHVALEAAALTLGVAGTATIAAVRRAVRVPPAEAMRPDPPTRHRRLAIESPGVQRRLGLIGRIVARNLARRPARAISSLVGVGFAVAVLMVGFVMLDAMDRLMEVQFSQANRQHILVSFVEPRGPEVRYALARLPGVLTVEPQRMVPVKVRAGHRMRTVVLAGVTPDDALRRIVDYEGRVVPPPAGGGVVISAALAEALRVEPGDTITLDVLEGRRPVLDVPVEALVDDVFGLNAYMDAGRLHAAMGEPALVSTAALLVDASRERELTRTLANAPTVASAVSTRAMVRDFRETLAASMDITVIVTSIFAGIIACGVIYNTARVSLSERSHELATLRVLGFTRGEISVVLLGELAALTIGALPIGWLMGRALLGAIFSLVDSEVYRFPLYISPGAVAAASLTVMAASAMSALLVRRRLDRLDLVSVLKVRE